MVGNKVDAKEIGGALKELRGSLSESPLVSPTKCAQANTYQEKNKHKKEQ
jgi:hypothetical protein